MRSEARKVEYQAWVEDKVDGEIAKNNRGEEAAETKQYAKWTLTTHTCIKNKIPHQFAKVTL